jgi:hypothetical protein
LNTRKSWEEQSKDGLYVGTSQKHYRTYDIWIKSTRAVQNYDTAFFKHKHLTQPPLTKADMVAHADQNLTDALKGIFAKAHDKTKLDALDRLAIFL